MFKKLRLKYRLWRLKNYYSLIKHDSLRACYLTRSYLEEINRVDKEIKELELEIKNFNNY